MRNYIALAIPFFFVLIGGELLWARLRRQSVYRLNDAITDLSCGVTSQVFAIFQGALQVAVYAWVYHRFRLVTFESPVWPWLLGHFIDAWRRTYPSDTAAAAQVLAAFDGHLSDACVGTVSEIFDAEPPYAPRGCVAQAWSVAELLRCAIYSARDEGSAPSSMTRPSLARNRT